MLHLSKQTFIVITQCDIDTNMAAEMVPNIMRRGNYSTESLGDKRFNLEYTEQVT